jgi:hypothetical protein
MQNYCNIFLSSQGPSIPDGSDHVLAVPFKGVALLFSDSENPLVEKITQTMAEIGYSIVTDHLQNAVDTLNKGI